MESMRDLKRVMEREIEKGSCPLKFSHIEPGDSPYQFIREEEKLDEIFAYLLRIKGFEQFATKTVFNNVYMDLDMLLRKPHFRRTHSVLEREEIYYRIQRYKKKLKPDFEGKTCLETIRCVFTIPKEEMEKYRISYDGMETYAFIMSHKYILGLFTYCEEARKSLSWEKERYRGMADGEQGIISLENVKDVIFQALLLDDVEQGGSGLSANLYTVYCLNRNITSGHHDQKLEGEAE